MEFREFDQKKRIPKAPLYAVVGDEPFLKHRAVDKVVEALSKGPEGAFAVRTCDFEGPEELRPASVGEILADVMTPSLFTKRSTVVVWRADKLLTKGGGAEGVLEYIQDPGTHGSLVLELRALDKRTRVGRAIRDKGFVVECKRLFDRPPPWKRNAPIHENPLAEWIAAEGRSEGLVLSLAVAHGLAERVGNDLGAIHEEIVKLALYLGADGDGAVRVDERALSESVGDYNEFGVFRLTDAVGRRDLEGALKIVKSLLEQGLKSFGGPGKRVPPAQVPSVLVGRIHAKMREIFRARALLDAGGTSEEVGKALGKHRAFLPALIAEARNFALSEAHGILNLLFRAERALKTGADGPTMLEGLLVAIAARGTDRGVPGGRAKT
ncbi:MAG: DNA polymerase III subunit delta [Planctomycetota bacterium]|jgi:DNA polymerase-3 subunit delta